MMADKHQSTDRAEGYFDDWSRGDLIEFAGFLLHSYRVMDAFWFLYIEEDHDLAEACRLNERVWKKVPQLAARDLKKRFGITGTGLDSFLRVLRLYPWSILTGYTIEEKPGEVLLSAPQCPPQDGRKKHGLGEYPCKAMHMNEFTSIAHEVNPAIRVECLFAPPDEHPDDCYCRWRFSLETE